MRTSVVIVALWIATPVTSAFGISDAAASHRKFHEGQVDALKRQTESIYDAETG